MPDNKNTGRPGIDSSRTVNGLKALVNETISKSSAATDLVLVGLIF